MNQLPARFTITLRFLSDWHIGTGQGRLGSVDAEVRRDGDGLPFVPAKTLVGVLRDACETVADVLDRDARTPGAWQQWVTWLFGSQPARVGDPTAADGRPPAPAALRVTPARAPEDLRAAVRGRRALTQAAVVLRPGVAVCEQTGTVKDGLLRLEERAIRGSELQADVSIGVEADGSAGDPVPVPAEILLRAGARMVESVGGKRNRGSGRVAVLLPGVTQDLADHRADPADARLAALLADTAVLDDPDLNDPGGPPSRPTTQDPHPSARLSSDGWRTRRVVLEVLTPVVAADGVHGNVISSRDAIPGTAMLGALLRRVERAGGVGLGDVRVGDAVPAVRAAAALAGAVPAWPAPLVWSRSDKGIGKKVFNCAVAAAPPEARAKPMRGRVARTGERWASVTAGFAISTHAVVDDEARRPTKTGGGVFTYLGIAPGTRLVTDVVLPKDAELRLESGDVLRFGRSRKDDFGMVKVCEVVDAPRQTQPAADHPADVLRVWCLSDVLLRDDRLAPDPSPDALARTLTEALRAGNGDPLQLEVISPDDDRLPTDTRPTVVAVDRREGFGVAWARPRGSQVGLKGGSVVTLRVTGGRPDPGALTRLELLGVGERTAEGFGRVRFDPPELTEAEPEWAEPEPGDKPADRTTSPPDTRATWSKDEPHPFEVNAWRQAIRDRAATKALDPGEVIPGTGPGKPVKAQLGALRAQLERLALPGGEGLIRQWLASTDAVNGRRDKWGDQALSKLKKLLTDRPAVWRQLGLDGDQAHLVLAPGREDRLREHLRIEAVTVLLTEVIRHLTHTSPPDTDQTSGQDVPS